MSSESAPKSRIGRTIRQSIRRHESSRTMPNPYASVLIACVLGSAPAALAQPAPAQAKTSAISVAPLTVQAAPSPAEVEKQTSSFVKAYAASTARLDQIARWRDPICVQVSGLVADQAALVRARLEDVAKAVGRGAQQAGCRPNIEIMFAVDPQALIDTIVNRQEAALGYYHRHDAKALKTVTRPIQAWYMTATVGGAQSSAGAIFTGHSATLTMDRVTDDPDNLPPTGCGDSHYSSCLQSVFDNILVVVDIGRVQGKSPSAVSDYVAMLALSQPRSLDGCKILPSVTDLFAACPERAAPDGLTQADFAYLAALYAADPEAKKAGQQSDIARRMAAILVKGISH